ncbi:MAG: hypothetical protein PVF70_14075 [Anaerolineales bacterium]
MIKSKWLNFDWRIATVGGITLFIIFSLAYLFLGQPNADEGWYLYASKLVFEGEIPYRDFAYTQTPLLPYIYGLPQVLLQPSIYLGRATSVALSIGNLLLCITLACRYAGERGAGFAALLLSLFTYGIYFASIVKTYALLSLLFTLTFFVLSSKNPGTLKYPLAVVLSFGAAMVRLSAVLFLIPIAIYSLASALREKTKGTFILVTLTCMGLTIGALLFFYSSDLESVKWNLLVHHIEQWGGISAAGKVEQVLSVRIPQLIETFDYFVFGLFPISILALRDGKSRTRTKTYLRRNSPIWVVGIGLALFSISHFATGGWHVEYFVPALMSFLPIVAIAFSKVYDLQKSFASRVLLQIVLFIILLVAPLHHNVVHIDMSGKELPLEEIREVSASISRLSGPSDRLFVLEALWTAIDSNRSVMPGMTMAQFSYQDMSREMAERIRLVNGEIVLEYINNCSAKVVVLTDLDWGMFRGTGYDELIRQALFSHYNLVLTRGAFGQGSNNVDLYLCRSY